MDSPVGPAAVASGQPPPRSRFVQVSQNSVGPPPFPCAPDDSRSSPRLRATPRLGAAGPPGGRGDGADPRPNGQRLLRPPLRPPPKRRRGRSPRARRGSHRYGPQSQTGAARARPHEAGGALAARVDLRVAHSVDAVAGLPGPFRLDRNWTMRCPDPVTAMVALRVGTLFRPVMALSAMLVQSL